MTALVLYQIKKRLSSIFVKKSDYLL